MSSTLAPPTPTTLRDVRLEIPRHLLEPDRRRAAGTIARVAAELVVATALAAVVWAQGWWFLAPVSWLVGSIAMTGLFVLGHDCGHRSLLRSDRAMVLIGHLSLSPVLYPFWAWKYSHDAHHRHTNLLDRPEGAGVYFDNAWNPYVVEEYARLRREGDKATRAIYRTVRAAPPIGSLLHLLGYHWLPGGFRAGRHRTRVLRSMAFAVVMDAAIVAAVVAATGSWLAVLHFWLLPAIGFHLWMALYTFLHHTSDDVTFLHRDEWNPFAAQVDGTLNVLAPRWLSYLHLQIDVHVPHHVSTRIPSYHLRAANAALAEGTWGHHVRERRMTLRYVRDQVRACHLWSDERTGYQRFDELD